jgi:toxin ParE1/3/4
VNALANRHDRPATKREGRGCRLAGRFVATESGRLETADRLIESITERFDLLSSNPDIGRRRDEDLRPGLRSFSVGQYVIVYRIENGDVVILYELHVSRDIESFFRQ